ncbi:MAG TPA: hypothetical protein VGW38_04705 [Chloroflexota bacterium]|nr:hypothetical protein [Chloroflexota bacterium]
MSIFDRLAAGPGGKQPQDYSDWNQMVGAAPPERFGRATYDAVRQVDSQEYYRHTQPGVDGTDPLGELPAPRRTSLVQSVLGELFRRGLGRQEISQGARVPEPDLDPSRMSPQELASLLQWVQREHPKAFGRVAAQHKEEPDLLERLLGNKALMMTVAAVGAKFLADRHARR